MKLSEILFGVFLLLPMIHTSAAEVPRFAKNGESSIGQELDKVIAQTYGARKLALRAQGTNTRVGNANVLSLSYTFREIEKPVTEKDFAGLEQYFKPFIEAQKAFYKGSERQIKSVSYSYPLPAYAKDYTQNELPTMKFSIGGVEGDLFHMEVTFAERAGNHLVIKVMVLAVD